MKKPPFGYALFIERDAKPQVWIYQTLEEAETALRACAAGLWVRPSCDEEIIETFAEDGTRVHIFACTYNARTRKQTSVELKPFTRAKAA